MDYSSMTERISLKVSAKGHEADTAKIEGKLRRLIEEFGVPPQEAERTVLNELARDLSIPDLGSGPGTAAGEEKQLRQLSSGDWATIEAKVVSLSSSFSSAISQTGILADSTGAMRFVVWAKANAPRLSVGSWYRFESVVVDEYKGSPNLKVHSGTTIKEIASETPLIPESIPIRDLTPGIGSVRAKFIQEWEVSHDRMLQSGLLGDESGTAKFVIWKEEGKERLVPGTVYSIYYALVDEYQGRISLNLTTATVLPEEGDIPVSGGEGVFAGALVHVAPGSGLIKRCPVEGCNRVLSRQNYCPVHEIQPGFLYDLRIKGWLDNGRETREILVQREVTEQLTGISLHEAKELAENNPLGMDEVFLRVRERILGRYLTCKGREMDQRILVSECGFLHFDPAEIPGLLNRAGGSS
ncbi:MAG: nucleotide-binding protein [Methanoregulaceae archaeon]|nr:nucleotide-binding protein [Methanoregulaceae archaeon]